MNPIYPLAHITAFLLGTAIGSFLALAATRVPSDRSILRPPSACEVCGTRLRAADNLPVISWLRLRGRCRVCHTPISPFFPLAELATGLVAWLLFRRFVPGPAQLDLPHIAAWTAYFGFASLLLVSTWTDARARIIPTGASAHAVPAAIGAAVALELLGYEGWLALGWRGSVLGALVGGGLPAILAFAFERITGRTGLAWGDVRMLALIGAFVGAVPGVWLVLLLASVGGAVAGIGAWLMHGRTGWLPFAPWLALASLVYVLYGDRLVPWLLPGMHALI